jgi:hypothetical protein
MRRVQVMCRQAIILGLVLSLFAPALAFGGFPQIGWTLSASPTDPLDNVGPVTTDTLAVYLWLWCSNPDVGGVTAAELSLNCQPLVDIITFEPSQGVYNNGSVCDLDLTLPDCPVGSFLAGHFLLQSLLGRFSLCIGQSQQEPSFSYRCNSAEPEPVASIGYAAGFGKPCILWFDFFNGNCFPAVSVEPTSWGGIKTYYFDRE